MLCSSPISAKTSSKIESSERSFAGIWSPAWPIKVNSPTVFKETVFPPVFGPVTISKSKPSPKRMSIGTTLRLSSSGWRPLRIRMQRFVLNTGAVPLYCFAREPLAKIKSNFVKISKLSFRYGMYSLARLLKLARMISISSRSFRKSSFKSLFSFTIAIGSIKRVEPVADWSCTMPGTCPLASAFTGRQ